MFPLDDMVWPVIVYVINIYFIYPKQRSTERNVCNLTLQPAVAKAQQGETCDLKKSDSEPGDSVIVNAQQGKNKPAWRRASLEDLWNSSSKRSLEKSKFKKTKSKGGKLRRALKMIGVIDR